MREILFRAWDKVSKKYREFDGMHDTMTINEDGKVEYYNLQNGSGGDEYILEQFTGLHDKNGVEIYEGDKVSDGENIMIVSWDDKFASFALLKRGWMYKHFFSEAVDAKDCEVIGKIHDNPELLS